MIKASIHPTDTGFGRILEMGRNLSREALEQGLTASNPVRLNVMGNAHREGWWGFTNRVANVSFAKPLEPMYETELWVNPANKRIFKSRPNDRIWKQVLTYRDLFEDAGPTELGAQGSVSTNGQPVDTIADLLAIDTNVTPDKTVVYVEEGHLIFALDVQSSEPSNPNLILQPNVGPGRWYQITSTTATIGNIDGGVY